jgi:hypothetical protein
MRFLAICAVVLVSVLAAPAQRRTPAKKREFNAPKVGIEDFVAQRDGRFFVFEGKVRNISDKPIPGITLYFEFFESDDKMISKKKFILSEAELEPGEDFEILAQTPGIARVITVRIDAYDNENRALGVAKPGPYYIE